MTGVPVPEVLVPLLHHAPATLLCMDYANENFILIWIIMKSYFFPKSSSFFNFHFSIISSHKLITDYSFHFSLLHESFNCEIWMIWINSLSGNGFWKNIVATITLNFAERPRDVYIYVNKILAERPSDVYIRHKKDQIRLVYLFDCILGYWDT